MNVTPKLLELLLLLLVVLVSAAAAAAAADHAVVVVLHLPNIEQHILNLAFFSVSISDIIDNNRNE